MDIRSIAKPSIGHVPPNGLFSECFGTVTYSSSHVTVKRGSISFCLFVTPFVLPANGGKNRVEPRGFEPLTSAVQSQIHDVVVVRRCSKMPAKQPLPAGDVSWSFAIVRVG
jgi:hypothetical protein